MPIFDQGYQHWKGTLSGHGWRWWTVTRRGVGVALKNRWTRLLMLFAWFPAALLIALLVAWGLIEQRSNLLAPLVQAFEPLRKFAQTPRANRLAVWRFCYDLFFQFEITFTMILVVLVGPGLVSQDLRFNALPLYFSRPLRRFDYFAGKLGVIAVPLAAVMIVPALIAYIIGVVFSLDPTVLADTFVVLLGALTYGLVVVLSAGTLMLALSSLSRSSRAVGGLWVGIWLIGSMLAGGLTAMLKQDWCPLLSYTENIKTVGRALLGVDPESQLGGSLVHQPPWTWSALVLLALMGLSVWILSLRVKSLDRLT